MSEHELVAQHFENCIDVSRHRTSPKNGILKAEAVVRFMQVLT